MLLEAKLGFKGNFLCMSFHSSNPVSILKTVILENIMYVAWGKRVSQKVQKCVTYYLNVPLCVLE